MDVLGPQGFVDASERNPSRSGLHERPAPSEQGSHLLVQTVKNKGMEENRP